MVDGPSRAEPERKLRSASFFRRLDDNRNNPLIATPTFRPSTKPIASHHIQFTEGLLAALAARIRCRFVRVNEYYYYSTADASLYKMRITTKPLWRLNKTGVYGHSPGRSRRARRHAVAKGRSVNRVPALQSADSSVVGPPAKHCRLAGQIAPDFSSSHGAAAAKSSPNPTQIECRTNWHTPPTAKCHQSRRAR